jgi:hypothetical protein
MTVSLVRDYATAQWLLFVGDRWNGKPVALGPDGWSEVDEHVVSKPLLVINHRDGQALLSGLATELQRNGFSPIDPQGVLAGTKAHLDDTKVTRDRLFALVEKLTK